MVSLDDLLYGKQTNDGSIVGQEFCHAAMKWDLECISELEPRFLSLDDNNKKQFFGYMFQVLAYITENMSGSQKEGA